MAQNAAAKSGGCSRAAPARRLCLGGHIPGIISPVMSTDLAWSFLEGAVLPFGQIPWHRKSRQSYQDEIQLTFLRSNILFLPFRRTHPVQLSSAIRQYISTKYDQHPDMFTRDMDAIDKLRTEAISSLEPHVSGIKKLITYAAQLVWIGGKFPIDVSVSMGTRMRSNISTHCPLTSYRSELTSRGIQQWDLTLQDPVSSGSSVLSNKTKAN